MLPTAVLGLDAGADGKVVYAACMDGVYEVNPETGENHRLFAHESYASGVDMLEPSGLLVWGGYDGALIWYDLHAKRKLRSVKAHSFWSWDLDRSPDGKYL